MPTLLALDSPTPRQAEGILALYRAEGWWGSDPAPDDPEALRRLVSGSLFFVVAEEGGEVVGMGRAIGDGVSDAYIQDVAVAAPLRGRGLGAAITKELVGRLKAGGFAWIGLIAAPGTRRFYERLGFGAMEGHVPMRLP